MENNYYGSMIDQVNKTSIQTNVNWFNHLDTDEQIRFLETVHMGRVNQRQQEKFEKDHVEVKVSTRITFMSGLPMIALGACISFMSGNPAVTVSFLCWAVEISMFKRNRGYWVRRQ